MQMIDDFQKWWKMVFPQKVTYKYFSIFFTLKAEGGSLLHKSN